jgi:hypothetical protein
MPGPLLCEYYCGKSTEQVPDPPPGRPSGVAVFIVFDHIQSPSQEFFFEKTHRMADLSARF